jgi:hypothetical protein
VGAKVRPHADENDVAKIYELTEPMMVAAITRHAEPIPGLLEFAEGMRKRDISKSAPAPATPHP